MNDIIFPSRRAALGLLGAAGLAASILPSRIAYARSGTGIGAGGRKLIFILQRGAACGLSTIVPLGDPDYATHRAAMRDTDGAGQKLDAMFALNPALSHISGLYQAKQALFVHAISSAYRERSHFDAQNIVETGGLAPYATKDGWMNRLLAMLAKENGAQPKALAYAPAVPAALRGMAPVASYAPSALPDASDDLIARVGQLYAKDTPLHGALETALATRKMAEGGDMMGAGGGGKAAGMATGKAVAQLMAGPQGADVVMVETGGWDTHNAQSRRLAQGLSGVDAMVAALQSGLGAEWSNSVVIVATEFGRTVAVNGTGGTDHGTGGAAMLLGGAVSGGRVIADWPGLAQSKLYEGRDLMPTISMESLISGAIAVHYALDPAKVARMIYPAHAALRPMSGLVRS